VQAGLGEVSLELRDPRLVAQRRIPVGRGRRRLTRIGAALAVHVVQVLGAGVSGLKVGVSQRPGRRDAVDVLDLPEIALTETEQDRAVDLGIAAHVVVLLGRELLAGAGVRPVPELW